MLKSGQTVLFSRQVKELVAYVVRNDAGGKMLMGRLSVPQDLASREAMRAFLMAQVAPKGITVVSDPDDPHTFDLV